MSIETITILLFLCSFVLLATGLPIAFAMGATAVIFAILFWGFDHLSIISIIAFGSLRNVNLVAIPLFILMGWIIYRSGIAEDIFDTLYAWVGRLRGGLGMGTIGGGALFGTICGDLVAAIFTISAVTMTPMMKRHYDESFASGLVLAGSILSVLIPPSIVLIIYASICSLSIGKLYLACFGPGFLLAFLYIVYVLVACHLKPQLGPAAPLEGRPNWSIRLVKLKGIIAPVFLLLAILVSIYTGIVTPMEASAIGAAGAFICAAMKHNLNWKVTWEACLGTLRLTAMVGWMIVSMSIFSAVFNGIGAADLAKNLATHAPGGPIVVVILLQIFLIIMGMIMDSTAMVLIFGPIFQTVIQALGLDPIWFGALFLVNLQTALMSPPYAAGIFFLKASFASLPEHSHIGMATIIKGGYPFALISVVCIALIIIFPQIAMFLPNLLIK